MTQARTLPASLVVVALLSIAAGQINRTTQTFVCGEDLQLAVPIPLRWDTIVLAGDGRLYAPCTGQHGDRHKEVREAALLLDAARSDQPSFRRLAAQAHGRLGNPGVIALLLAPIAPAAGSGGFTSTITAPLTSGPRPAVPPSGKLAPRPSALDDENLEVRRMAASAIGDALAGVPPEPIEPSTGWPPTPTNDQLTLARLALTSRLAIEQNDYVAGTILETLGRLRYTGDATRTDVELLIDRFATGGSARILGAVKGLEALIYGNTTRPIDRATRQKLREWTAIGPTLTEVPTIAGAGTAVKPGDEDNFARARRLALLALAEASDDDTQVLEHAAADADWQVRRLVAGRVDLGKPAFAVMSAPLAVDPAFQVRYEFAGAVSRLAAETHDCRRLLKMTNDPAPQVAMRAIDELPESCAEPAPIVDRLVELADALKDSASGQTWHVPTHAWIALARLSPARARSMLDVVSTHVDWPVRAAAATVAGILHDDATLATLADDREPNVRTAAIQAMAGMKSHGLGAAALRALDADDYQLLLMAATVLKSAAEDRDVVVNALLSAYQRVTRKASDTSRDVRVGILQCLQVLMPPPDAPRLFGFRADVDPAVRAAARTAASAVSHGLEPPAPNTQYRYPLQPTSSQLQQLPREAKIRITGLGAIDLVFLTGEAPVTVARFVELARAGYYNGLTLHRVVPNLLIQGGSPGANGYAGTARYWRDEIGLEPHTRGAVGLSTHGRDRGDGQIFIDLTDQPRFDHDYTVFARVMAGFDVVDGIMEGARIESITVK